MPASRRMGSSSTTSDLLPLKLLAPHRYSALHRTAHGGAVRACSFASLADAIKSCQNFFHKALNYRI
jgi:hypothetical protein